MAKTLDVNRIMHRAGELCSQSGVRLTDKRAKLLEILVRSETPMSAYELADHYNREMGQSMPAMSVYRILDFLEQEQLVHKLSSTNKYLACAHIACAHEHEIPQFLICRSCQKVKEIGIKSSIVEELSAQVGKAGFKLMNSQLELDCLCKACAKMENAAS